MLRRIFPKREYKSGTGWCFWRWTYTWAQDEYITRLHLLKTPYFALCLHWINGPDPEPHMHDHPVSFLSLILRGGYDELRNGLAKSHDWWNYITASKQDCHRIFYVKPNTLTLCFMGPKTREWGFHTDSGWVYRKDYNKKS